MRWCGLVCVLAGCYQPTAQPGAPCSPEGNCPSGQTCDLRQLPPTCVIDLAGTPDAGVDASVDAPPIQCTTDAECPASQPVCGSDKQCRGCIADAECDSDVCHELRGACIDEANAAYVDPLGVGQTCTRAAPCSKINDGVKLVTTTRNVVRIADGTYAESLDLKPQNVGVTSIILSGTDRSWDGAVITPNLGTSQTEATPVVIEGLTFLATPNDSLENRGTLTLSRVLIAGSNGHGIRSRGTSLVVLDSRIQASEGIGIRYETGRIEVQRTVVVSNAGGGIASEGGSGFTIVNTVLGNNGSLSSAHGAARLNAGAGAPAVFEHNTVAGNQAGTGTSGLVCQSETTISSSIFAGNGILSTDLGTLCSARHSLFATNPPQTMGNKQGLPRFVSPTDFHLTATSEAIDCADGASTVAVDLDLDPRPGGAASDCGADEYRP